METINSKNEFVKYHLLCPNNYITECRHEKRWGGVSGQKVKIPRGCSEDMEHREPVSVLPMLVQKTYYTATNFKLGNKIEGYAGGSTFLDYASG